MNEPIIRQHITAKDIQEIFGCGRNTAYNYMKEVRKWLGKPKKRLTLADIAKYEGCQPKELYATFLLPKHP